MKKIAIIIFYLLSSLILSSSSDKRKVVMVGDNWCPFICQPGSGNEGFLVEIARVAFAKKNIEFEYKIVPWSDAVKMFKNGEVDGILGAADGELEDFIYPSVEQARSMVAAYTLKNTNWIYDGSHSLQNRVLGIIDGYSYSVDVKSHIYSNYISAPDLFVFSSSETAIEDTVNKLLSGEIFVYLEDENVMTEFIKQRGLTNIRNAGYVTNRADKIYIAFSKKLPNSDTYAKLIADTTFEMRANGKINKLLKKYNIKSYK